MRHSDLESQKRTARVPPEPCLFRKPSRLTFTDSVARRPSVRSEPEYGFSKTALSAACKRVKISREHRAELVTASALRYRLKTQADYDAPFAEYRRNGLPQQTHTVARITRCVRNGHRVSWMCFERTPERCHRHCVAEARVA